MGIVIHQAGGLNLTKRGLGGEGVGLGTGVAVGHPVGTAGVCGVGAKLADTFAEVMASMAPVVPVGPNGPIGRAVRDVLDPSVNCP